MHVALAHMRHAASGGTERYLDHLATHLAASGHEVTVVCRSHVAPPHPAVRFHVLHDLALGGAWRMWAFARALERHVRVGSYDLVVGLGKTWTHDVIRLGGGCHATYLDVAHAASLSRLERRVGAGRLKHRLALRIEARALATGAYRRVITNSEMVRHDVARRHGVRPETIDVIGNGVDLERFHPRGRAARGAETRRRIGLTGDELAVLFLGTGYGRKGLDLLLDAFGQIRSARPRARLIVVGRDSDRARYEARAARAGLSSVIHFAGPTAEPEAWYAAADLYVLPTRYDPFANATLEALASGLPVITSDRNGGAEVLEPGVQGTVVAIDDGADVLAEALQEWTDADRLAAARGPARALAERHGIASKMEATRRLFETTASAKLGEPVQR